MPRTQALVTAATLGLAASLLTAAPAAAGKPYVETIHEEFSNHFTDFCDADGLVVDQVGTFDSRLKITTRSGLAYFAEHITVEEYLTGAESGVTIRTHTAYLAKDLKVRDNHDGTLTITQLLTGPSTMYGPDGKAIARDPGQVRFRLVIDDGGTPDDPSDDSEISFAVVKASTGRSDDYCAAAVAALS